MSYALFFLFNCKILDRKNMELEEVKSHYRNKITEMEAAAKKQERKGKDWGSLRQHVRLSTNNYLSLT